MIDFRNLEKWAFPGETIFTVFRYLGGGNVKHAGEKRAPRENKMRKTTVRITAAQHHWITEHRPQGMSAVIREALETMMHEQTPVMYHNAWRESAQKCYPFTKGGYCAICWPAGIPSRTDWNDYLQHNVKRDPNGFLVGSGATLTFEEWYNLKIESRQTRLDHWNRNSQPHEIPNEKGRDTISDQPKRKFGWFRRFFS